MRPRRRRSLNRRDRIGTRAQPHLLETLHNHGAEWTHRDLDDDAVCSMIGKSPTNDKLSDGRSILLNYDGRQGKRAGLRANQGEDRNGCNERVNSSAVR